MDNYYSYKPKLSIFAPLSRGEVPYKPSKVTLRDYPPMTQKAKNLSQSSSQEAFSANSSEKVSRSKPYTKLQREIKRQNYVPVPLPSRKYKPISEYHGVINKGRNAASEKISKSG
jgi:hypothetical protein